MAAEDLCYSDKYLLRKDLNFALWPTTLKYSEDLVGYKTFSKDTLA